MREECQIRVNGTIPDEWQDAEVDRGVRLLRGICITVAVAEFCACVYCRTVNAVQSFSSVACGVEAT